ncbi:hypothetical protein SAMN02745146_0460 [Hymenobacter daecheongensis DSM 21074]|uniref:Carboxypeptidase regulatory-like domain-containing protein n=1 Tax=Hymenobacter daecheongensis DSM 21074 TaxID=1121955 RepID=A0A1M6A283_9BACT|nr:SdrD B-like domain-containing protein [Hymenobacter daecheongensis]SHI30566.1 hypothetical protein SAMN02745146_0460 [Hymenobacter daecheongensis DSM 21074]
MRKFSNLLFASICALSLLANCTGKQGDPGPAGPAGPTGPNMSGSLVGFVNPISEDGTELNKAGVTVTVTSVTPQLTQTTNASGRYEFANLKNGTYNLSFSRNDLGTFKIFGFGHVGGDAPTVITSTYVPAISQTLVTNLRASAPKYDPSSGYYTEMTGFFYNNAVTNSYRAVVLYGGTTSTVSSTTGTLLGTYYVYQYSGSTGSFQVTRSRFTSAGFAAGSTAYVVAYGVPDYYSISYNDPTTGRTVFPAMNPTASQVVPVVVP